MIITKTAATRIAIVIIFMLVVAQSGIAQTQSSALSFKQRIALFNYDNSTDLSIKDVGSEKRGPVTIRDITFVGIPGKDPVSAYLVDQRAKTHVFVAVTSSLYNWAFFANQPKSKLEYVRQNAVFELTDFVRQIKGSVLCQFSTEDPFIAKTDGPVFYSAITANLKERKNYDAKHAMEGDAIASDRNAWLIKELGLAEAGEDPGPATEELR